VEHKWAKGFMQQICSRWNLFSRNNKLFGRLFFIRRYQSDGWRVNRRFKI